MKAWKFMSSLAVAATLMLGFSATSFAQQTAPDNMSTHMTFSNPVELPGITLPAGTYVFRLMDAVSTQHTVQILSDDYKVNYGIFQVVRARIAPSGTGATTDAQASPMVMFRERPAGTPQAVRAWIFSEHNDGVEFIYPKAEAQRIAEANHVRVPTAD